MNQEQKREHLYLIMTGENHRYCLYRVGEPQVSPNEYETSIRELDKPLLEMDESMFPDLMGFIAVDSRIFMVGGEPDYDDADYDDEDEIYAGSKDVFIYDTNLSTLVSGPKLNSGKACPHLISLGTKIFVLSNKIHSCYARSLDSEPRFEMLDTVKLERGWSPLPIPKLPISATTKASVFTVYALAAVFCGGRDAGIIVLSSEDAGTWVFDVDKEVWDYVMDEMLPFKGTAMSLPHDPSLSYAFSLKSQRFSAFRFCYGGGDERNASFQVEEIEIGDTDSLSPPLPPKLYYRPRTTVLGPDGLVYFVDSGVDNAYATHTLKGNRYVKVNALKLSNLNHGMKKRHIGHSEDKDETTKVDLNKRQWLISCTNTKREMRHVEEHDGTLDVALNKAKSSKRGKKKRQKEQELILTRIWRSCFFGGPICDPLLHVAAAFAV